jgi:5-methylcytosine-specific restriction endonuclease McrA
MGQPMPRQIKTRQEKLFTRRTRDIYRHQRDRAREAGKSLDYTLEEFRSLFALALAEGSCWYCHRPITTKGSTADHAQPVSREGEQGLGNIRVTCLLCNMAKGNLTEEEFFAVLDLATLWPIVVSRNFFSRLKAGAKLHRN